MNAPDDPAATGPHRDPSGRALAIAGVLVVPARRAGHAPRAGPGHRTGKGARASTGEAGVRGAPPGGTEAFRPRPSARRVRGQDRLALDRLDRGPHPVGLLLEQPAEAQPRRRLARQQLDLWYSMAGSISDWTATSEPRLRTPRSSAGNVRPLTVGISPSTE